MQNASRIPFFTRSCFYAQTRPRLRTRLKLPSAPQSQSQVSNRRQFSSTPVHYASQPGGGTPASSLLTQTLDQRERMARGSQGESVGPFMIGISHKPVKESDLKKWSELNTKEKVKRTATRTTNLTVIVFGAGFTALLVYALTSELFARNSPTVLYGQACERIKASEKISQYLCTPLTFHNNPPSAQRPRHRNRRVSSHLAVDSAGREHLLLNFYIRGSSKSASTSYTEGEDDGPIMRYVGRGWRKVQGLKETTWDDAVEWGKERWRSTKESARRLFLYLTGEPVGSSSSGHSASSSVLGQVTTPRRETQIGKMASEPDKGSGGGFWSGVAGLFSGLGKGLKGSSGSGSWNGEGEEGRGEMYEEGEVHADLVKDAKGNFVWRYLIVDMPNSRVRNPRRVFIERREDVQEGEGVMRWY